MSTTYKATVLDILTIISDLRGETDVETGTERIHAVSRAEQDLAKRRLQKLFFLPGQTVTSSAVAMYEIGNATYPMRNKGDAGVYVGSFSEDDRYERVDAEKFPQIYAVDPAKHMYYIYFDPANDKWMIYISPTPEAGQTIYMSYYWLPPDRTATTDPVVTLNRTALAYEALGEIFEGEDEEELGATARNKGEQMLDMELGIDQSPSYGQTQTFGSTVNQSGNKGFGTY